MTKRSSLACATFALLAACGGGGGSTDIEATLRFADLTDAEISRLVSAASGSEGFQAQAQIGQFEPSFGDPTAPDPCPAITVTGDTVTITGGCTTADGLTVEGTASVHNPLDWGDQYEYDFTSDTTYEFQQFALVQSTIRRSYDGVFVIGSSYSELDMDLTTDSFDAVVRSDIYMDCGRTSCTVSGSGVELVGVGGAKVSGRIVVGDAGTQGTFTLRGLDTVKVTIDSSCVSWTLEGTDRAFSPCAS